MVFIAVDFKGIVLNVTSLNPAATWKLTISET